VNCCYDTRYAVLAGRAHGEQRGLGGAAAVGDCEEPADCDSTERRPDRRLDHRVPRRIQHRSRAAGRLLLGSQVYAHERPHP